MSTMDPNGRCSRCRNPAPLVQQRTGKLDGQVVIEDVRLCTPCKIRADRENAAAGNRGVS